MRYGYFKNSFALKKVIAGILLFLGIYLPIEFSLAQEPSKEELYTLANAYFDQKNLQESEATYRKLIELYPDYAQAYNNLGLICSAENSRLGEGVQNFIQAIKIDPRYPQPYSNLGVLCYRINQFDKAEYYLQRAIQLEPKNFKNYFDLGWVYLIGIKNYERAIQCFEKVIAFNPNYSEAYYALGMAFISSKQTARVLEQITKLREMKREDFASALEDLIRPAPSGENVATEIAAIQEKSKIKTEFEIGSLSDTSTGTGKISGKGTIQMQLKIVKETPGQEVKQEVKK